jgi:hypothetical protein
VTCDIVAIVAGSSSPGIAGLAILHRRPPSRTESLDPTATSSGVVEGEGPKPRKPGESRIHGLWINWEHWALYDRAKGHEVIVPT